MEKLFLTDVDNCLLDWSKGFADFVSKHHPDLVLDHDDYSFGIDRAVADLYATEYNTHDDFANMETFRDARLGVSQLVDMGFKLVAITSCLGTDKTYDMRIANLNKVFGDVFKDIICIPIHTNKQPVLEKFTPTFWVDDKLDNCIVGAESGHKSFIMDTVYNTNDQHHDVARVKDWHDLLTKITGQ